MSFTTFNKEVWATSIQGLLENASVANAVANRNVVPNDAGDKFHILGISDVSVAAYTQGSGLTYNDPTGTDVEFTFNIDNVVPLVAYDKDVQQSSVDWQMLYADRAGHKLRDAFDAAVFADYASAADLNDGVDAFTVGTDASGVPAMFARIAKILNEANLPQEGRYVVIDPAMKEAIDIWASSKGSSFGDQVSINGFAGNLFGLNVYVSNNLTTATSVVHGLAGVRGWGLATADLINPEDVEVIRDKDEYANFIRTRHVAGHKIYKATEIFDLQVADAPLA